MQLFNSAILMLQDVIIVSIYGGQRDEKSWPDPDVFKYDRHLSATAPKGDAMYCPFSMGSRTCVFFPVLIRFFFFFLVGYRLVRF